MRSLKEALEAANKLPDKIKQSFASDYCELTHTLREAKGMTWREVKQFYDEIGLPFSETSIQSSYFKWRQKQQVEYEQADEMLKVRES